MGENRNLSRVESTKKLDAMNMKNMKLCWSTSWRTNDEERNEPLILSEHQERFLLNATKDEAAKLVTLLTYALARTGGNRDTEVKAWLVCEKEQHVAVSPTEVMQPGTLVRILKAPNCVGDSRGTVRAVELVRTLGVITKVYPNKYEVACNHDGDKWYFDLDGVEPFNTPAEPAPEPAPVGLSDETVDYLKDCIESNRKRIVPGMTRDELFYIEGKIAGLIGALEAEAHTRAKNAKV
jgi:hypothetical protein